MCKHFGNDAPEGMALEMTVQGASGPMLEAGHMETSGSGPLRSSFGREQKPSKCRRCAESSREILCRSATLQELDRGVEFI